jgi:hypothetical protein
MEFGYRILLSETIVRHTYLVQSGNQLDNLTSELRSQGWRQTNAERSSLPPYEISATFEIEISSAMKTKG